jgi:putative ABC transport system ATP-binding protein
MPSPIISVQRLCKQVADATGTLTILHDIAFDLAERESVAIVGASGSGKSTLLSILAGLDVPTSGTVVVAGTDLFSAGRGRPRRGARPQMGFVFQSFQLLAHLTALENVMLPLELMGRPTRAPPPPRCCSVWAWANAWATTRACCRAASSSAWRWRAPSSSPAVLLADEPTGSLDFATGEKVMELMFAMNREAGTTLVLVTHDRDRARCDRQLRIEAGRLAREPLRHSTSCPSVRCTNRTSHHDRAVACCRDRPGPVP